MMGLTEDLDSELRHAARRNQDLANEVKDNHEEMLNLRDHDRVGYGVDTADPPAQEQGPVGICSGAWGSHAGFEARQGAQEHLGEYGQAS